jgi:hypothetical protein
MQRRFKQSPSSRTVLETLESRLLLSSTLSTVHSFQLTPTTDPPPAYHDFQIPANGITRLNPDGTTTQFQLTPGDTPGGIAYDSHNNLWFTNYEQNQIDNISPSGQITRYTLPDPSYFYRNIVVASDDSVWFTENLWPTAANTDAPRIARLTADGGFTDFALPSNAQPAGPALAPSSDGSVWVGVGNGSVLRVASDGTFSEIDSLPGAVATLVPGANGNVWYGGGPDNGLGRSAVQLLAPDGPVASATFGGSQGDWLVAMPDGGAEAISYDRIIRMEPDGSSSTTNLNTTDPFYSAPVFDSQGNLWIGSPDGLTRMTPDGQSTFFGIPHPGVNGSTSAAQLAAASDGSIAILWSFGGAHGDPTPGFNTLSAQIQTNADGSFTGTAGRFTYDRGHDSAGSYTATIDWGDGQTSAGTVVDPNPNGNSGIYLVTGTHTYAQPGVYTTTITPSMASETPPISPPIVPAPPVAPPLEPPVLPPIGSPIQPPIFPNPPVVIHVGVDPQSPQIDSFYMTPVVTTVDNVPSASYTATVQGRYNGTSNSSFTLTFYGLTSSELDVSNPDLASLILLGSTTVTTDSAGKAAFLVNFAVPQNNIAAVDGIATDASGNTSTVGSRTTEGAMNPVTDNESLVTGMYRQLLGRSVDPVGFATWTYQLDCGSKPDDVATEIQQSVEYRNKVVQGLYQQLLHRDADAQGLAAFSQLLLTNAGDSEQVASAIAGSPEYFQTRGGGTIDGFINAVYHDALGRAVDPTGQAFFNDQFSHDATTAAVAQIIYTSTEYNQNLITGYYNTDLDRHADPAGEAYWMNELSAGRTSAQVASSFLGSSEFSANGFYNGQRITYLKTGAWFGLAIAHEYTVMTRNNADFAELAGTLNLPVSNVKSLGGESSYVFDTTADPETVYAWQGTLATVVSSIDPNGITHVANPL